MSDADDELYLSWGDEVTGPFSLEQIRSQLRQRKISSLHKVQIDGDWRLLRDVLRESSSKPTPPAPVHAPSTRSSAHETWEQDTILPNDESIQGQAPSHATPPEPPHEEAPARGRELGIAAFILSFFFFIPFLNIICLILAIVFGHMSLGGGLSPLKAKGLALPWFGTWASYVHGTFLLFTLPWAMILIDAGQADGSLILGLHFTMFGYAISACIGAGLIMAAVRMLASYTPPFHVCYIAALIPVAVGNSAILFLGLQEETDMVKLLTTIAPVQAGIFGLQLVIWASLITSPSGKPLGHAYAAVASLFCTAVSIAITFGFFLLISTLS